MLDDNYKHGHLFPDCVLVIANPDPLKVHVTALWMILFPYFATGDPRRDRPHFLTAKCRNNGEQGVVMSEDRGHGWCSSRVSLGGIWTWCAKLVSDAPVGRDASLQAPAVSLNGGYLELRLSLINGRNEVDMKHE